MKLKFILIALLPVLFTACQSDRSITTDAVTTKPAKSTETINLSSDTLFQFNRSALGDMLPGGVAELNDVIDLIEKGYMSISQIAIIGHTDRIGTVAANQHLGMQRALTVQNYLRSKGVQAEIVVVSMGERQPRTQNCSDQLSREALKNCLQPDRRVTIHITGVR